MTQQNFHKFFIFYFIVFGIAISLIGTVISYSFQLNDIQKDLDKKAKEISEIKINTILKPSIVNMDNIVKSLSDNKIIKEYVLSKDEHKKQDIPYSLFSPIRNNSRYFKVVYLYKRYKWSNGFHPIFASVLVESCIVIVCNLRYCFA